MQPIECVTSVKGGINDPMVGGFWVLLFKTGVTREWWEGGWKGVVGGGVGVVGGWVEGSSGREGRRE